MRVLPQVATAIRGAIIQAKMSVVPVRRGYWGNKIGKVHTVPVKVRNGWVMVDCWCLKVFQGGWVNSLEGVGHARMWGPGFVSAGMHAQRPPAAEATCSRGQWSP